MELQLLKRFQNNREKRKLKKKTLIKDSLENNSSGNESDFAEQRSQPLTTANKSFRQSTKNHILTLNERIRQSAEAKLARKAEIEETEALKEQMDDEWSHKIRFVLKESNQAAKKASVFIRDPRDQKQEEILSKKLLSDFDNRVLEMTYLTIKGNKISEDTSQINTDSLKSIRPNFVQSLQLYGQKEPQECFNFLLDLLRISHQKLALNMELFASDDEFSFITLSNKELQQIFVQTQLIMKLTADLLKSWQLNKKRQFSRHRLIFLPELKHSIKLAANWIFPHRFRSGSDFISKLFQALNQVDTHKDKTRWCFNLQDCGMDLQDSVERLLNHNNHEETFTACKWSSSLVKKAISVEMAVFWVQAVNSLLYVLDVVFRAYEIHPTVEREDNGDHDLPDFLRTDFLSRRHQVLAALYLNDDLNKNLKTLSDVLKTESSPFPAILTSRLSQFVMPAVNQLTSNLLANQKSYSDKILFDREKIELVAQLEPCLVFPNEEIKKKASRFKRERKADEKRLKREARSTALKYREKLVKSHEEREIKTKRIMKKLQAQDWQMAVKNVSKISKKDFKKRK